MEKQKYLVGDVIGTYTIIGYTDTPNTRLCRCNACGSQSVVRTCNISRSIMCSRCRTKSNTHPKSDLTGLRFGKLVVESFVLKPNGHTAWECICDCGNRTLVTTNHLKSGHTQSCGCYMRERISESNSDDLTGQRFGRLLATKKLDGHDIPSGQKLSSYLCKCDCGAEVSVLSMNLVSGNSKSCGCIGASYGEFTIQEFLSANNITFTKQYSLPDLRSSNGGLLKFDFAIWSNDKLNCLVEYNGEQHYYQPKYKSDFGRLQREETDTLKEKYCRYNNIKLFVIRFDDNLNDKLSEVSQYYTTH